MSEKIFSHQAIQDLLCKDGAAMIARFGSTEIKAVLYGMLPTIVQPVLKNRILGRMNILSGFFPANNQMIKRFSELMLKDMQELDILGSWRVEEKLLHRHLKHVVKVPLSALEPYFSDDPWSQALEGKNVLVIHPFSETIESQYNTNREKLFKEPRVLPPFKSLQTIKAVQTIAGNKSEFATWFDALDYMKNEIEKKYFDIAIIGCGAYGFPLAAHVKRLGKKAIHLGGATQVLFGIKGKRWLDNPDFKDIINAYFVSPLDADKPKDLIKVEDGCYW